MPKPAYVQAPTLTAFAVGGPTAVIEYAGMRLMTDPTFDPPGTQPDGLVKVAGPAAGPDDVGAIDIVLLSHDHHSDNLDQGGRAFLQRAGLVITTTLGAERLGGDTIGLEPWASLDVARPDGRTLTITAVPAQHGPDGTDHLTGPVIGFVLTGQGVPSLYVSGDNASVDVVRRIVGRLGSIELAILFTGAVSRPNRFGGAYLTLSADRAVEATRILGARAIVPVHFEGWTHYTQGSADLRATFAAAGLSERLVVPEPGATVSA
jgi:L-ascorbate metabolism protein UlaG (beta-lactamase superfamily)